MNKPKRNCEACEAAGFDECFDIEHLHKRNAELEAEVANVRAINCSGCSISKERDKLEAKLVEQQKEQQKLQAATLWLVRDDLNGLFRDHGQRGRNNAALSLKLGSKESECIDLKEKLDYESEARDEAEAKLKEYSATLGAERKDYEEMKNKLAAIEKDLRENKQSYYLKRYFSTKKVMK